MKVSELKALGESATSGPWRFGYVCIDDPMQRDFANRWQIISQHLCYGTVQAVRDAEFITTMRNHWDALLKIADAVSRNPCRHTSDHKSCDTCEALAELERVK